jgi:hypothetical protein
MIKLGSKVKDHYTGFSGIATGRTEWLYGCSRICIECTKLKDGKPIESQWFDEQRVDIIEEKSAVIADHSKAKIGGPHNEDSHRNDPMR